MVLLGIFSLLFWALLGLPPNHTYFLLIFFIIYLLGDIFIEWKKPKKYSGKESSELRNLNLNESLTYSTMLLSIGFASVVAGVSFSNPYPAISLFLIIIGGIFVLIGEIISKFIYQPRAQYLRK